jgi:hypothetical protein
VAFVIGALLQDGRPEPEELQELWDIYSACWTNSPSNAVINALEAIPQAFNKWLSVRVKDSRQERVLILATSSIHRLRIELEKKQQNTASQNTQSALEAFGSMSVLADQTMKSLKHSNKPTKHSNQTT